MKEAKKDGYLWPKRILYFAQYASLLPEKYASDFGTMSVFIEDLGYNTNINTLEQLKDSLKDYQKKYWKDEYDEVFSTENIQKFRNSNYTEVDLNKDLNELHQTINNHLGWSYQEVA